MRDTDLERALIVLGLFVGAVIVAGLAAVFA